jgi:hypothetical protein
LFGDAQATPKSTTVEIGGANAVLLKADNPIGSLILLSGGDGVVGVKENDEVEFGGNQVVRTRMDYALKGFNVLVPDAGFKLSELIDYMRSFKKRVTVVATSRGTIRAALGIRDGAQPDKLILTSGILSNGSGNPKENVIKILSTPEKLPPTLIIYHQNDHCETTNPAGVEEFVSWSEGKARAEKLTGGQEVGIVCGGQSHHGFLGIDSAVVNLVIKFATR